MEKFRSARNTARQRGKYVSTRLSKMPRKPTGSHGKKELWEKEVWFNNLFQLVNRPMTTMVVP